MTAAPIYSSQLSASPQPSSSGSNQGALTLARWHSLEFLQRGIERVPRMAADGVCDHLRVELARVVKAGRVDRNQFRHCDECQIDRRSTGRAEGVDLFVPAVARYPPGVRFARNCHIGSLGEGQIGSMPRATSFLAIAALAVVLEDGFAARFIADRAARASAGIGLGHCHSPAGRLVDWHRKGSGRFWLGEKVNAADGFQERFQAGEDGRPTLFDAFRHPAAGFEFAMGDGQPRPKITYWHRDGAECVTKFAGLIWH